MDQTKELAPDRGLYFEDFSVGQRISTPARTITEADIVAFAGLTGDGNPLHTDAEYARTTIFGERIAHGLLILSIGMGLAWRLGFMEGTVEAFRGLEWKFSAPVKIGDTIHLEAQVADVKPMPRLKGGIVTLDVKIVNQRNETVEKGTWEALVRSKGPS